MHEGANTPVRPYDFPMMKIMLPQRRALRLRNYDYSWPGAYYVTIVTQQREPLFGAIANDEVQLNAAGQMIEQWWQELLQKFPQIELDASIIMPNHLHGIIVIPSVGVDLRVGPQTQVDPQTPIGSQTGEHTGSPLPTIMQWFKTMTTNAYIRGVKEFGWPAFPGKLWHRSFYEHVVRDEVDLNRIREYIANNPLNWLNDTENPVRTNP